MVKRCQSTKLFYKIYPYKISYKRLYGFPSPEFVSQSRWGWWFDVPGSPDERTRRDNCYHFLKNIGKVKFSNSQHTHVYFIEKDEFEKACGRYKDLQIEQCEPFVENLSDILEQYDSSIDIKNNLYHKKYRYKIDLKFNKHLENSLGPMLAETYMDNENYHLNPNVRRFIEKEPVQQTMTARYTWAFRHSTYHNYSIYCREHIDMELMTFIASENISKITKAVLKDEIDK